MKQFLGGVAVGVTLCIAAQCAYALYDMVKFMDRQMGRGGK